MNHITLQGKFLLVRFKFDPKISAALKSIDGRIWNPKSGAWEIPIECLEETMEKLVPLGLTPTLEVKALHEKQTADWKAIDTLRTAQDHPYEGKLPLMDFQRVGAAFLRDMPSALLGDAPGLGKTLQLVAGTERDSKVLIFTFNSLKFTTENEIKKWVPDAQTLVIDGDKEQRFELWHWAKDKRYKYVIANYELLIYDIAHLRGFFWPVIACDEATRISNPEADSVRNLKTLDAGKRIAMTGTPVSNSPEDVFSIIDWIMPKYLGSFYQFRSKYCVTTSGWARGHSYEEVTGYKNLDELSKKVNRLMLRRKKENVLKDFPPKVVNNVMIPLSETEQKAYTAIKEQLMKEIREMGNMDPRFLSIIPVKMLRLKQATDHLKLIDAHAAAYSKSSKFEVLRDMLKPIIASGEKAIVFTQFSEMLHIMASELQEFRPLTIFGDVDSKERMLRIKEFNDDPQARIIIMTEAGAYGFNMQSATYVFHYDLPWSIAKLEQREDRAHRKGQTKLVTVYNLLAKGTIDEYVFKLLEKKRSLSDEVLGKAVRDKQTQLSRDDIDEILK